MIGNPQKQNRKVCYSGSDLLGTDLTSRPIAPKINRFISCNFRTTNKTYRAFQKPIIFPICRSTTPKPIKTMSGMKTMFKI